MPSPLLEIHSHIDKLSETLSLQAQQHIAAHQVEQNLWTEMLSIGQKLQSLFFSLCGDGDVGKKAQLSCGRTLKRLKPKKRDYLSIFGHFTLTRQVYGTREGQKIEYVPLDKHLQLADSKFSYLLQDWNQAAAVDMPYRKVSELLQKVLGFKQSVNSLERNNRDYAKQIDGYWADQPIPEEDQEGELLVCTADGKGVPMRRDDIDWQQELAKKPTSGLRPGDKKMALVGAVYTVDAYQRTPENIVDALFHSNLSKDDDRFAKRPKPCFKRVRASILRDDKGTTAPQTKQIFSWIQKEVRQRGRTTNTLRPLILLMDGQESLWNAGEHYLPVDHNVIEILDLLHAVSYVWDAFHVFSSSDHKTSIRMAKKQILRLVSGDVKGVLNYFRSKAYRDNLSDQCKMQLVKILRYLENNASRMRYKEYLEAGYPIASGIIEGACRTVIKDRMERAGMRWVLKGAYAMMSVRCIQLSDLWTSFFEYKVDNECLRLYSHLPEAANDVAMNLKLAA